LNEVKRTEALEKVFDKCIKGFYLRESLEAAVLMDGVQRLKALEAVLFIYVERGHLDEAIGIANSIPRDLRREELNKILKMAIKLNEVMDMEKVVNLLVKESLLSL